MYHIEKNTVQETLIIPFVSATTEGAKAITSICQM